MQGMIQKLYYRWFKRPETLVDALKSRVSPSLIDELLIAHEPGELISVLSESRQMDKAKLLGQVASKFNCMPMPELRTPSLEDIKATGYSEKVLRDVPALPLSIAAGYMLVVSDPKAVDIKAYFDQNVPVGLSTLEEIRACWDAFDSRMARVETEYDFGKVQSILLQLASDSSSLGAIEVVVGAPSPSEYELQVGPKVYRGKLPEEAYHRLCVEINRGGEDRSWQVPHTELQSVTVLRNDAGPSPVFYMTWKHRSVLPMSKYREADKGPVPERRSQNHKPTVDVLFLDDSAEFSAIAVNVLRDKGFSVTKESNPKIALGKLVSKEWRPKVIVSDVHMPQMTGVELLRELREQGVIGPVVMLTSDENPELEVELAGLGCDAFIRKQQKPEVLLAWVKNLMERRGYVVKERRRQRNVRNRQERREEAKRPAVQQSSVV